MSNAPHRSPVAIALRSGAEFEGVPEVTHVSYDLGELRVTLRFDDRDHPLYVIFDGPPGFRVLDEGDLCEFWDPQTRPSGWIWQVQSGGWLDLERTRPTFISGMTESLSEFLVIGKNDCVSVLAHSEPRLERLDP
jgi:hypothetical protein